MEHIKQTKTKGHSSERGMAWMAAQIPVPDEHTLMDYSAKSIADLCSNSDDLKAQLTQLSDYSISGWIKIKIGLFLRGALLDVLIGHEEGLATMAVNCVSELFEPFLVHILHEQRGQQSRQRIDQISLLHQHIRAYSTFIDRKMEVDDDVHRLGLTERFPQTNLIPSSLDQHIYSYYRFLNGLETYKTMPLPLIYPIPHVLRISQDVWSKIQSVQEKCFPLHHKLAEKQLEWNRSCGNDQEMRLMETNGISLSPYSQKQQSSKCATLSFFVGSDKTGRYIQLLSAMARSHHNGAHHLVLYTAFQALTQSYYTPNNDAFFNRRRRLRQQCRFDVFVFLSMALSSLYANMDLPMACLWKARQIQQLLSDHIRYAVAYQSILVDYGLWSSAHTLYLHWYNRIPSSSRLFRELVLVHVKGVFYQIENLSAEIWITRIKHNACSRRCYEEYIERSLARITDMINNVKNIAHQFLAFRNLHREFESELELMLHVCTIYSLTVKQMTFETFEYHAYKDRLLNIWQQMQWYSPGHIVHHLKPFVGQLPYCTNANYFWTLAIDQVMIECRERLSKSTHVVTSRVLADCLFSIGVCMLYHSSYDRINIRALSESLEEYERYTNGRHYRIPLIKQLIRVIKTPDVYQLPFDSCVHPNVPKHERTLIGLCNKTIHQFCSTTLDDATTNFVTLDATNDELFIAYLANKDEMMRTWMSVGQQTFLFASDI